MNLAKHTLGGREEELRSAFSVAIPIVALVGFSLAMSGFFLPWTTAGGSPSQRLTPGPGQEAGRVRSSQPREA